MEAQFAQFINKGMNQDISISKASNEFAYENYNIRITAINDSTQLTVTNEKVPKDLEATIKLQDDSEETQIKGRPLGYALLKDYIVLFTNDSTKIDRIYRLELFGNDSTPLCIRGVILYEGSLNFEFVDYIDTLPFFESDKIQKVYWVDGINPPRVINIVNTYSSDTSFDFVPPVKSFPSVTISKEYSGVGLFPSGVVQYFLSYYNKFGSESGIIWASDLQYITEPDRGVSAENNVVCSFKLDIKNLDSSYEYLRVYSVIRTSIDATPIAKVVKDINIKNVTSTICIDTNTIGYNISIEDLLFLGLSNFSAKTITQKDNTLFLGNLSTGNSKLHPRVVDLLKKIKDTGASCIFWDYKYYSAQDYQLLQRENFIKTFKYKETYRFALQFQDKNARWSEPFWIEDSECNCYPKIDTVSTDNQDKIFLPTAKFQVPPKYLKQFKETIITYYRNYRLLIAEPTVNDRTILAQGFVNPTMFNVYDRIYNTGPYSIASWIARPKNSNSIKWRHLEDVGNLSFKDYDPKAEIQNVEIKRPVLTEKEYDNAGFVVSICINNNNKVSVFIYEHKNSTVDDIISIETNDFKFDTNRRYKKDLDTQYTGENDAAVIVLEIEMFIYESIGVDTTNDLSSDTLNSYLKNKTSEDYQTVTLIQEINNKWASGYFVGLDSPVKYTNNNNISRYGLYTFISRKKHGDKYLKYNNNFYIDESIVTFHSPEIEDNESLFSNTNLKFRLIGAIPIDTVYNDAIVQAETPKSTEAGITKDYLNTLNTVQPNLLLYKDVSSISDDSIFFPTKIVPYYMYMWGKKGSIIGQNSENTDSSKYPITYSVLKHKILANRKYSNKNTLFNEPIDCNSITPTVFNSNETTVHSLKVGTDIKTYSGNFSRVLTTDIDNKYKVFYRYLGMLFEQDMQVDPVSIDYKTTEHLVFSLGEDTLLPYFGESYLINFIYSELGNNTYYPWKNNESTEYEPIYTDSSSSPSDKPFLLLGEIYRDIASDVLYGGTSEEALQSLNWIPASDVYSIDSPITNSYGDTYYQRYDCLLSYPSTEEDLNSVVDITSFMVETHKNISGRFDKFIGDFNILNARKTNFNQFNPVYNQMNNLFTYKILDSKFDETKYTNQFAFSLTKTPMSDVDVWTKISLANSMNLDGIYGDLTKITKLNNNLITFQEKAISAINFNSRTALTSNTGASILLANSGKVDSTSIITTTSGCKNIKAICQANTGIYYIDDEKKSLMRINSEGLVNISSQGMSIWFKQNITGNEVLSYDALTHDIYISNYEWSLVFNEDLQTFTSFFDYYKTAFSIITVNGKSILLDKNRENSGAITGITPKQMFGGNYTPNYWITYKVNPEVYSDKIFSNVEFTADCTDGSKSINEPKVLTTDIPFTKLRVWNEYQHGDTDIRNKSLYPDFKQKFRIWRVDIPRDASNNRDRIRNPWAFIRLSKSGLKLTETKTTFHNLLVKYYK